MKNLKLRVIEFSIHGEIVESSKRPFDLTINTDHIILIYKRKILMQEGVTIEVEPTADFNRLANAQ